MRPESKEQYLMFSVDKADSWRQVDRRRLKKVRVSAGPDGFTGKLRQVGDLRVQGLGALDAAHWLFQDVHDMVNWGQSDKWTNENQI